ncbi:hypothetical protein AUC47_15505 [Microbacterium sp. SZ1]|uniref:endonuclease domain-containing protein n=1 Tax=Microbacterium sp. SZ1 TaxID=1849736 RepID=UPI000BD19539|nr:endonuclease domain-containing protein [Microbacterium sp. SZ1]PCE14771.1 hypothetical protein AUC47_15505 [Microbacterium sp. SZ1]
MPDALGCGSRRRRQTATGPDRPAADRFLRRRGHCDPAARSKDLRRDAAASALGFETLRFTYAMVVHHWPTVERAILGAMIRHGLR